MPNDYGSFELNSLRKGTGNYFTGTGIFWARTGNFIDQNRNHRRMTPRPFHHGIRRRGGTIYWTALPTDERQVQADKRTHLIIVPRGTSFHRWVELECSPVTFDPVQFSCCCFFPCPLELSAINPYAEHDHGQPTRQRHDRLLHPAIPP